MGVLFQKNNFPINEGAKDFSAEYVLPANANAIFFNMDNGGNGGLFDNRSESTVMTIALFSSMDGGVTWEQFRGGTIQGAASCPIDRTGNPNCTSYLSIVGLAPERGGVPRRIRLELSLAAVVPNEKTIQIRNYMVSDDT